MIHTMILSNDSYHYSFQLFLPLPFPVILIHNIHTHQVVWCDGFPVITVDSMAGLNVTCVVPLIMLVDQVYSATEMLDYLNVLLIM